MHVCERKKEGRKERKGGREGRNGEEEELK